MYPKWLGSGRLAGSALDVGFAAVPQCPLVAHLRCSAGARLSAAASRSERGRRRLPALLSDAPP